MDISLSQVMREGYHGKASWSGPPFYISMDLRGLVEASIATIESIFTTLASCKHVYSNILDHSYIYLPTYSKINKLKVKTSKELISNNHREGRERDNRQEWNSIGIFHYQWITDERRVLSSSNFIHSH